MTVDWLLRKLHPDTLVSEILIRQFCGWGSDTHQVCAAGTGIEQSEFHFPPPWTVKIASDKLRVHSCRCSFGALILFNPDLVDAVYSLSSLMKGN
jgi:hypothetical protein